MDSNNTVCPVCTLFLRPGITLKNHLASHPKQKVIEALCRLSTTGEKIEEGGSQDGAQSGQQTPQINTIMNQAWNNPSATSSPTTTAHGNHVFIYQQSMSSTTGPPPQQTIMPPQQYFYPTILSPPMMNINSQMMPPQMMNPQMMPYVYQQQQVIMSSGTCMNPIPRPIEPASYPLVTEAPPLTESSVGDSDADEAPTDRNLDDDVVEDTPPKKEECKDGVIDKFLNEEIQDDQIDEPELYESNPLSEEVVGQEEIERQEVQEGRQFQETTLEMEPEVEEVVQIGEHQQPLPLSPHNSIWSIHSDLNKACQTNNVSPRSTLEDEFIEEGEEDFIEKVEETLMSKVEEELIDKVKEGFVEEELQKQQQMQEQEQQQQQQPVTTTSSSSYYFGSNYELPHGSQHNLNFIDMEMDFSSNHIISQVENFEVVPGERPGVLMTIGGMVGSPGKADQTTTGFLDPSEESVSRDINMRADERMPPRGELSGQESLGDTSDITWNRVQYMESGPSYELMSRECWGEEASDGSDAEMSPLQSCVPYDKDDTPTIVSISGPPLNFKCSSCEEAFACLKDRKEHEALKHPEKVAKARTIGSELGRKSVKKLTIKSKPPKSEASFDFSQLKAEAMDELAGSVDDPDYIVDTKPELLKSMCTICDVVCLNARLLRDHMVDVHNFVKTERHKCATCGEVFKTDYLFTEHLQVHPLECNICGKLFYKRQNINLHMRRHSNIKPYKCETCPKAFLTKQKLDEHRNTHTGESPIKCALCNETFRRHSNLVQHRNRHHFNVKKKIKDFICHCRQIFHSKKKLAWHQEIHDPKPKACTMCNEKFIHMSSLTRHVRRAHNNSFLPESSKSKENAQCPICQGTFLKSSLEVHIRNHSGVRPYACSICNKDFTTKWNLKLHKWTHASRNSKPYRCNECKSAFIRESDHTAHMNSHKSIRPFTCNYCGAQFIRKYNCQRHVKEHENEKTYTCQVCPKTFHRSYYLKDHMRIHSGVRPFACHICGKTSTTKSNHNKHVQIHHAREPVSTEN